MNLFYDDPLTGLRLIAGLETRGEEIDIVGRKLPQVGPMQSLEIPPWFIVEVTGTRTPLPGPCLIEAQPGGVVLRPAFKGSADT